MGSCLSVCLKPLYKRRVLKRYTELDSRQVVDDGATLVDDDSDGDGLLSSRGANTSSAPAITENEKLLLKSKNYAAIIKAQKNYDEQIDRQLAEQEAKLKAEEEEQRRLRRLKNKSHKSSATGSTSTPISTTQQLGHSQPQADPFKPGENSDWNVAGGDDDFDMFLDSIATRDRSASGDAADEEINEDDFVNGFSSN